MKVSLWIATLFGCFGAFGSAAEQQEEPPPKLTHENLTFLNFSDKIVNLYWVDNSVPELTQHEITKAYPYQSYTTGTFSGHVFTYSWGEEAIYHVAESTSGIYMDKGSQGRVDTSSIRTQVHILGDIRIAGPEQEAEYQHLLEAERIKPRSETKKAVCGTTKGDINITIKPFWSPHGAARFLRLIHLHRYFDGCALNRVVPKFLVQFGIGADYDLRTSFRSSNIPDDPKFDPPIVFQPGYMSYAGSGPNSRSSEVFIAQPDARKSQLEYFGVNPWETPFGYVEPEDLNVVASWHSYGDMEPWGKGPDPQKIYKADGYEYLEEEFPELDYIRGCAIVPDDDMNDSYIATLSYDELVSYVYEDEEKEEEL